MLKLIFGIAGSGKSTWILEQIRARAEQKKRSILLVPEQFTSSTEGRIYRTLGDALSGWVDSYSFSSLAELLLRRYGGAATPTITDAGRVVLVRRAVESLGEQVHHYRRHRRSAAFCQLAAETVNELKSAGLTAEDLARYAENAGPGSEKLQELALILSAYESLIQGTAMDPGDRVELAAERLDPQDLADLAIFVDEFDTFNASKKKLLRALLPAVDLTVALCADGLADQEGGMGLFSGAKQVAQTLLRMAHSAGVPAQYEVLEGDLRHSEAPGLAALGRILAGEPEDPCPAPEITLLCAENRLEEARAVAGALRQKAREGVPYSRMAVVCRESEQYLSPLRYALRLADVPLFFDEPATPENTPPARAVKAAVELLRRGLGTDSLLALVKTGLCDLTEEQQCALENYAYTWPLRAADWRQSFRLPASGYEKRTDKREQEEDARQLELAEQARALLVGAATPFLERARGGNALCISKEIYLLFQRLGAERAVQTMSDTLRAEQGIPAAEECVREWNLMVEKLDELARLLGQDGVSPGEYGELFTLLMRSTDLGHIPQSLDAVILTTAGRMRLDQVDVCFVLGLAEGEFPKAPGEAGLLTHADRDLLIRQGAELPDCFENRLIREQICFYRAMTAPRRQLWLSWPGGNLGTPLTSALSEAVALLSPQSPRVDTALLAPTPQAALDALGALWQRDDGETAALYQALERQPGAEAGLDALRRVALEKPFAAADLQSLERVLGRELRISPSRVEQFYTCRFGYFMKYVLRVQPRPKAELTPNQSGSLVHWVLENALKRTGERFVTLSAQELEQLSDTLTEEYVRDNMPDASVRFRYLVSRLKRSVADLLRYLQKDLAQSSFAPVAFEQKIGGPELPPITLTAPDGHTVRVAGTIDRVDALRRDGHTWLRVVDYKTGEKNFRLEEVYCGLDCQMLLYLFALCRGGERLYPSPAPAGVLYLMADPAPRAEDRETAGREKVFRLDGLVLDDPAILHAMDKDCSGLFVPVTFKKDGTPRASEKLASLAKLGRIQKHIDALVTQMAVGLYRGEIEAQALCARGRTAPCLYCEYRGICRHEDGKNESRPAMPEHYFDHDPEPKDKEETHA